MLQKKYKAHRSVIRDSSTLRAEFVFGDEDSTTTLLWGHYDATRTRCVCLSGPRGMDLPGLEMGQLQTRISPHFCANRLGCSPLGAPPPAPTILEAINGLWGRVTLRARDRLPFPRRRGRHLPFSAQRDLHGGVLSGAWLPAHADDPVRLLPSPSCSEAPKLTFDLVARPGEPRAAPRSYGRPPVGDHRQRRQ